MTARERAREAAEKTIEKTNIYGWDMLPIAADAASDVWEPIVTRIFDFFTAIELAAIDPDQPGETQRLADILQLVDHFKNEFLDLGFSEVK